MGARMNATAVTEEEIQRELGHQPMARFLEDKITPERLVKVYDEALEASVPKTVKIKGRMLSEILPVDERFDVIAKTEEEVLLETNYPDHVTRLKAAHQVHKLKGDYPAEEHHITSDFSAIMADVIGEIDGRMKGKLPSQMENGDGA